MSNTIKLSIQGMNCGHCVKRVTNALKEVAGVTDVKVDLADNSATVTGTADIEALKAAVDEAGYEVVSFTTAQTITTIHQTLKGLPEADDKAISERMV